MLPKQIKSFWTATTTETNYPQLSGDMETDVVIVGGGIAGLNAAYFLMREGMKIILLEASQIATGTSGNTTAKVTSQHNLKYAFLQKHFGLEKAEIYADSNQWAIAEMEQIIEEEKIECDFVHVPAYVYAVTDSELEKVQKEIAVCQKLNLPVSFVEKIADMPFPIKGAIEFADQAYFHPRKYLLALAEQIQVKGGKIFEQTRALNIKTGAMPIVVTDMGEIKAKKVIIATNYPFFDKGLFFLRTSQARSYGMAIRSNVPTPKGMFINNEGKALSFRPHLNDGKEWLIAGGESHMVGEFEQEDHFANLEKTVTEKLIASNIEYIWASQDSMPIDKVPFMGKMPRAKNIFVTTGFGKWGITTSFVSAKILTDLILDRKNEWAKLYSPWRFNLTASFSELKNSMMRIMKGYLGSANKTDIFNLADLQLGEGKIIRFKGRKIAVFKDEQGIVLARSAVCTHLGCTVNWNHLEKTWDCPCHGSRFNKNGEVIQGPANKPLEKTEL